MPAKEYPIPEQLYQQGIEQFNRAEWRAAIDTLSRLKEISDQYPDLDDLIADARLKLQFETAATMPPAMAPPRRPVLLPILAAFALLLLAASAYGFYYLNSTAPDTVAAVPTATQEPPTPTPTIAPTSTPTREPTPEPTEVVVLPATVVVTAESVFVNTPRNIEIIVDASGSMRNVVAGTDKQRWQVAQDALRTLITSGQITEQTFVAVRTYGRQRGADCSDMEILRGIGPFNTEDLLNVVGTIEPAIGARTPLAASIRAAVDDLQATEGHTVLIVVSDGDETCNGDPPAEAAYFVSVAPQRQVHVIGFALDIPEDAERLRQIALQGNGLYFDADDSAQLAAALRQTIVLSYQISDADGVVVASGEVGGTTQTLDPGTYLLKVNANPPIEKELVVPSGGSVVVNLRQGFGGLIADVAIDAP